MRARSIIPAAAALYLSSSGGVFAQPPDTMAERVRACASCHGGSGEGTSDPYFPRLAGKPAGYLYNQLLAFKSGRRRYPPMNYLLAYLPDAYLLKMSEHFAAQKVAPPSSAVVDVSATLLERGKVLVTTGDASRNIPSCVGCHGPRLTGMEPAVPGLLGLRAAYLSAQLGAWRYGTRTAASPDCMQIVAGHLTEDDVRAVSAWLAAQEVPADSQPVPKGTFAMPFACGSVPQ